MRIAASGLLVVWMLIPTLVVAQEGKTGARRAEPTTTPDPSSTTPRPGLAVAGQVYIGQRAPDFELDASSGKRVKLSRMRGDWVLLVFSERKESLLPLETSADSLRTIGVLVLGVCKEKSRTLETLQSRHPLPLALLADVTGEISAMYGLYDSLHSAVRPGFVVLDRDGIVRMAVLGQELPVGDIARLTRFAVTGL
jgi:peroxiredoxin Q/BCP